MSIKRAVVVELQDRNLSGAIDDEVHELWQNMEMGKDHYYYRWNHEKDKGTYPEIAKYIADNVAFGEVEILIHWWW